MKSVILADESLSADKRAVFIGKSLESSVYIIKALAFSVLKFGNKRAELTDYNGDIGRQSKLALEGIYGIFKAVVIIFRIVLCATVALALMP